MRLRELLRRFEQKGIQVTADQRITLGQTVYELWTPAPSPPYVPGKLLWTTVYAPDLDHMLSDEEVDSVKRALWHGSTDLED